MNPSKRFSLNEDDVKRVIRHLAIVAIAAVLAEALRMLPNMNFGANQILIVPVVSVILKACLTFFEGK